MKYLGLIIIFFGFISCDQNTPIKSVYLQSNWQFQHTVDYTWYPATVPGVIHTDLLQNNLIPDPFWETNELDLQWIENENWNYKTTFTLNKKHLKYANIDIEFEGLDTYADVFLNGNKILSTDNMFRSWSKSVKKMLVVGTNTLEVHFTSPINKNAEKVKNYKYQLPSGNETVPLKVSSFTRKAAYHFGWDWGPRFVTTGIWKPVKLNFWNNQKIESVFIKTDSIAFNKAYLTFQVEIKSTKNETIVLEAFNEKSTLNLKDSISVFELKKVIDNPNLWWPNGMGNAYLYNETITLSKNSYTIDNKNIKFGIRTIDLVHEKDQIGTAFYFKVNDKPIFIKGANYIPQDVFLPRVTTKNYENLIQKVVDANMNMIRVWGGGIYENDLFYELCDANGILIWQDFMFAGSLYPDSPEFLANIKNEVNDNVKRLRNHPSIALWCGNNEIEVAWKNWGWQKQYGYSGSDSTEIYNNYKQIFEQLIPKKLAKLDGNANYVSTSPTSNWGTAENFNHGSMHYWGVWHGKEPFANFETNVGRFMVEYGFQSYPSMETVNKFASDSSLHLQSKTMVNRQKSYIGNGLILSHINQYFDTPNSFSDFVEKGQQTQAIALQTAIQAHRKNSPHCMGTMFWQLNDCWPGPSWSVIDYYGNEKLAYNTVKENFKSIIAIFDDKNSTIDIISDSNSVFIGLVEIGTESNENVNQFLSFEIEIHPNSKISKKIPQYLQSKLTAYDLKIQIKDRNGFIVYQSKSTVN